MVNGGPGADTAYTDEADVVEEDCDRVKTG
jgi:hypothetical protein